MGGKPTEQPKPKKRVGRTAQINPDAAPAHVYDRQPKESDPAWLAFRTYRDMGLERSLRKTREKLERPEGYMRMLEDWSSKHDWRARVKVWDEDEYRRADAEEGENRKHEKVKERKKRRGFLRAMEAKLVDAISSVNIGEPEQVRALTALFDKVMTHSRQEFNDLPMAKVAPVDASDPEGETPYQPRVDDFASIITSVKELLEQERRDDNE